MTFVRVRVEPAEHQLKPIERIARLNGSASPEQTGLALLGKITPALLAGGHAFAFTIEVSRGDPGQFEIIKSGSVRVNGSYGDAEQASDLS